MMIFDLPQSVEIDGEEWSIRTDFRDILTILIAFDDPDMEDAEKVYICLFGFYVDFDEMPQELYGKAFETAMNFIDHGNGGDENKKSRKTMDWEQDANMLFPAVNKVAGYEVRAVEYLHWWTFLGFFMEITEGTYSTVLSLRTKKYGGKKLEKWESEFWSKNKAICEIKTKYSTEELAAQAKLNAMI